MDEKQRNTLMIVGAVVLLALAAIIIGWTVSRPAETITDYKKVPPKGAGRFETDDRR